jgi:hypothetical protein
LVTDLVVDGLRNEGKTGFVGSTDTHEGKPAAKTAVLATELTRPAIFDAIGNSYYYPRLDRNSIRPDGTQNWIQETPKKKALSVFHSRL